VLLGLSATCLGIVAFSFPEILYKLFKISLPISAATAVRFCNCYSFWHIGFWQFEGFCTCCSRAISPISAATTELRQIFQQLIQRAKLLSFSWRAFQFGQRSRMQKV
jgi:hypothetical protein